MANLIEIKRTVTISITVDENNSEHMEEWLDSTLSHHIDLIEEMAEEEESHLED